MDIQLTDYENSALVIILGMITNVINHFDVDFIMPITMIDENMDRAHKRDGLLYQKFWWKTNGINNATFDTSCLKETDFLKSKVQNAGQNQQEEEKGEFHELFIYEILQGKPELGYAGLLPLFDRFML